MKVIAPLRSLGIVIGLLSLATPHRTYAGAPEPLRELPYSPGLDLKSMDKTVEPCQDFFHYACGGWIKQNPIPADQESWDVYGKLTLDNEQYLWGLLDTAAKENATGKTQSPANEHIGRFFRSCMDLTAVDLADLKPAQPALDAIASIKNLGDLSRVLGDIHSEGLGGGQIFAIESGQEFENAESVIAFAERGSLGLPDRDYYTKTDKKSVEIRGRYFEHLQVVFGLIGDSPAQAKAEASQVMGLEDKLARATLTRVEMRDPARRFNTMPMAKFKAMITAINWDEYFKKIGIPDNGPINVTELAYYKRVATLLRSEPISTWKSFLRWGWMHRTSPYLSSRFVNADFEFYSKYLRGTLQPRPRWRKCTLLVDREIGEDLGQAFVAKTFSPDTKARALEMTRKIETAMEKDVNNLSWMSQTTRTQALAKLHSIVNKIGFPDKWRDYSPVDLKADKFFDNMVNADRFEQKRQLAKIGKLLDRSEWGMTPPTVNAYYDEQMNDINFPAGVLQPPLFDRKLDDAPNYGNTGSTIGHELTHGFDDEGRKFNAQGNLKDWWTAADAKEFERRAGCVSDQYSKYIAVDDIHINGKLTNGEDLADLGGTILAYAAWKDATAAKQLKPIDGLTPDQRFFIGMAQWACGDTRPETKREHAITNPHSPLEFRVNGVVSNMPEFAKTFSCKAGQPMVRANVCRVW